MTGLELSAADLLAHGATTIARATLLLIGALGLSLLLRRAPAAARHALWTVTFLGLLALPVLPLVVPPLSLSLPELPGVERALEPFRRGTEAGAGTSVSIAAGGASEVEVGREGSAQGGSAPEAAGKESAAGGSGGFAQEGVAGPTHEAVGLEQEEAAGPVQGEAGGSGQEEAAGRARVETADPTRGGAAGTAIASGLGVTDQGASPVPSLGWSPMPWLVPRFVPHLLLLAWLLGGVGIAVPLLLGLRRAGAVCRQAILVREPGWLHQLRQARRAVDMARRVSLRLSPLVRTGMAGGVLRPVVILPETATRWSPERRDIVLLHELVHLKRGDPLRRIMGRFVLALYWFHPLAWYAARSAALACEEACDEAVVALGHRPATYARHLIDLADAARLPMPALSRIGRPALEKRIMRLFRTSPRYSSRAVLGVSLIGIVWVLGVAAASPADPGAVTSSPHQLADTIPTARSVPVVPAPIAMPQSFAVPRTLAAADTIPQPAAPTIARAAVPTVPDPEGATIPEPEAAGNPAAEARTIPEAAPVPDPTATGSGSTTSPRAPTRPTPVQHRVGDGCRAGPGAADVGDEEVTIRGGIITTTVDGDRLIRRSLDGATLCMRTRGGVSWTDDGRRISAMDEGAWVVLAAEGDGVSQRLEIAPGPDGLEHVWFVDGAERPFGAQARDWRDAMLEVLGSHAEIVELRGQTARLRGEIARTRGEEARLRGGIARIRAQEARLRGGAARSRAEETRLRGETARLRAEQARYQAAVAQIHAQRGQLAVHAARVSALERARQVSEDPETRARLEAEIEQARARADAAHEAEPELERAMAEVQAAAEAQREALEERVAEIQARLEGMETEERVAEIERQLEAQREETERRIAEVEREISTLDVTGQVREIEERIRELDADGRIQELEERLESAEERLRAIIGEITDLDGSGTGGGLELSGRMEIGGGGLEPSGRIEVGELGGQVQLKELGAQVHLNRLGAQIQLNDLGEHVQLNELGGRSR